MSDRIIHPFPAFYDSKSKVLILGSFPSVASREGQFFYHHPQNRFWKLLSQIYDESTPLSIEEKKNFLLRHHIAVWDVIKSCEIVGSSDSSIRNVVPNDITGILKDSSIESIITNGGAAFKLYMKYIYQISGYEAYQLPSTSPANAGFNLDKLIERWSIIKSLTENERNRR